MRCSVDALLCRASMRRSAKHRCALPGVDVVRRGAALPSVAALICRCAAARPSVQASRCCYAERRCAVVKSMHAPASMCSFAELLCADFPCVVVLRRRSGLSYTGAPATRAWGTAPRPRGAARRVPGRAAGHAVPGARTAERGGDVMSGGCAVRVRGLCPRRSHCRRPPAARPLRS